MNNFLKIIIRLKKLGMRLKMRPPNIVEEFRSLILRISKIRINRGFFMKENSETMPVIFGTRRDR